MGSTKYASILRWWPAIAILSPIVLYAALQLFFFLHRPMLYNVFGRSDHMLFSMWIDGPYAFDQQDNIAIADYRLNLLVVFLTGESGIESFRFMRASSVRDGAVFPDPECGDALDFHVPRLEDALIVFHGDGSRREFPLMHGEAESLLKLLDVDSEDMRPLLIELYADKRAEHELRAWMHR